TISTGAIKNYKILTESEKPEGNGYLATVNATVSLPHLVTYAKNHGSECEFAGNTFGMDLKLFKIQKENELKALYDGIPMIVEFAKKGMKHVLSVSEPTIVNYKLDYETYEREEYDKGGSFSRPWKKGYEQAKGVIELSPGVKGILFEKYHINGLLNSPITRPDGIFAYQKDDTVLNGLNSISTGENVLLEFKVKWIPVDQNYTLENYIDEFLSNIALDLEAFEKYEERGYKVSKVNRGYQSSYRDRERFYRFRNCSEDINNWYYTLLTALDKVRNNVKIVDNTGTVSDFALQELSDLKTDGEYKDINKYLVNNIQLEELHNTMEERHLKNRHYALGLNSPTESEAWSFPGKVHKVLNMYHDYDPFVSYGGSGLFSKLYFVFTTGFPMRSYIKSLGSLPGDSVCDVYTIIPTDEIGKYSSFRISSTE
ncbi:MAG: hypothetical protein HDS49_03110, partial [Bacteroides sp.]|nr:hypothetical protein [Bacteroides sp.]